MNRFEKLEWLQEMCTESFASTLLDEMVQWMGEKEFDEFYNHLCRNHDIPRTPNELEAKMNDWEYDEDTDEIVDASKE